MGGFIYQVYIYQVYIIILLFYGSGMGVVWKWYREILIGVVWGM